MGHIHPKLMKQLLRQHSSTIGMWGLTCWSVDVRNTGVWFSVTENHRYPLLITTGVELRSFDICPHFMGLRKNSSSICPLIHQIGNWVRISLVMSQRMECQFQKAPRIRSPLSIQSDHVFPSRISRHLFLEHGLPNKLWKRPRALHHRLKEWRGVPPQTVHPELVGVRDTRHFGMLIVLFCI